MIGVVGKVLIIVLAIVIPGGIPVYLIYLSGKRIKERNAKGIDMVECDGKKLARGNGTVQDNYGQELL